MFISYCVSVQLMAMVNVLTMQNINGHGNILLMQNAFSSTSEVLRMLIHPTPQMSKVQSR